MKRDAVSIKELKRRNNKKFNQRGHNVILHIVDFERSKNSDEVRYVFLLEGLEDYSVKGGHLVTIKFDVDTAIQPLKSRPYNEDCHVHCQCPAFQYWGAAYNATQENYNLMSIENRAPDVRDPNRNVKLCKHLVRVSNMLARVSWNGLNKRAGYTAANFHQDVIESYTRIPVEETFPALMSYLERHHPNINPLTFCASLNRSNYEQKLVSIGAII